jgi:hypothetical protein
MTPTINRNGQQRKSLAGQIDRLDITVRRLDAVLDGLAEGLNGAVASVVQEAVGLAVKEAVRAVLSEVLQNAELLARLQQPSSAPATKSADAPAQPRFRLLRTTCQVVRRACSACQTAVASAVRSAAQSAVAWITQVVQRARHIGAATKQRLAALLDGCSMLVGLARSFPGPLATGLVAGIATGVAVFHASPWISATTAGLGSFVLSSVLHLGMRSRSLLPCCATAGSRAFPT